MSRIAQNIRNVIVTNKSSKCPIFPIFLLKIVEKAHKLKQIAQGPSNFVKLALLRM